MQDDKRIASRRHGFSLLELIAVVTIMGILLALVLPRISGQTANAKKKLCHSQKSDLNSAIERYRFETGAGPADLDALQNSSYFPEAIPKCPVNNQAYEISDSTGRISGHTH